jgi:glutathione S-transferase
MKLYFSPGACSMAVHIVLREAGYPFEIDKVDFATQTTASGEDYRTVNGKGYVPALRLDDGQVLTEVAVILQYLADHQPAAGLAPPAGTMERYRLMEWLNFIASEIHKTLGALFHSGMTPEWKAHQIELFGRRAAWVERRLAERPYLMGAQFSVADAYLFTVLRWCKFLDVDLAPWPAVQNHQTLVGGRPAVQATLKAELPAA